MKLNIILAIVFLTITSANSTEIKVITEHYPPLQIVENGKPITGLAIDIMKELLRKTEIQTNIQTYPWARAYKMALSEENILIFSLTRTKERESQFKWVGEIIGVSDYLWGLKENTNIKINSLEETKKYTIAVPKDGMQHHFLNQYDFSNLYITTSMDSAFKMLYSKRVDLIMDSKISTYHRLKKLNLDPMKLEKKYEMGQQWGDLSIAFSLKTSDKLVKKFQNAFKEMKNDGTYEKIILKWVLDYDDKPHHNN